MAQVLKVGSSLRQGGSSNAPVRGIAGQGQGVDGVSPLAGVTTSPVAHPSAPADSVTQGGSTTTMTSPSGLPRASHPLAQQSSTGDHTHIVAIQKRGGTTPSPQPSGPGIGVGTPIIGSGATAATVNGAAAGQVTQQQQLQQQPGANPNQSQQLEDCADTEETQNTENLANIKEKTPMCLVNELARFNKIQHQYTLTDEQGPAHKKTFFVVLKLGDEEYHASGPSIKKGQHAAAGDALRDTQYKHPPPKPPRAPGTTSVVLDLANPSITPTVELNALAMKRGEPAVYRPIEPARPPYYPPNLDFRGMYNQRYHFPKYPRVFYVSLKVGQREFIGEGNTRQAARHNAAEKALKILNNLPLPNGTTSCVGKSVAANGVGGESPAESADGTDGGEEEQDELKSEISLVHEIALKRNLQVNFEVIKESGPPHMRTFVTRCTCGDFKTEAEGNSKKLSKKRTAERMLEEIQRLPDLPQAVSKLKKPLGTKKKNRNLIKKANVDYGVGINPISRLIQIQQAKKEKEPAYSLVEERGLPRRREFVMQVTVGEQNCTGVGPNKKLAKRSAAEAMLLLLGYSRPAPQPAKPAIRSGEASPGQADPKKVTFREHEPATTSRQLVPGVIIMNALDEGRHQAASSNAGGAASGYRIQGGHGQKGRGKVNQGPEVKYSPQTTAAIAKELLDTGSSPTAESIHKTGAGGRGASPAEGAALTTPLTTPQTAAAAAAQAAVSQSAVRPKQQLLYLADVLGFQVQFTDFPKGGNKVEYLSLVSLSTTPPRVSHGAGVTLEASHDLAALHALQSLAEIGLDSVAERPADTRAAGDGPHVKTETADHRANSADASNAALKQEA